MRARSTIWRMVREIEDATMERKEPSGGQRWSAYIAARLPRHLASTYSALMLPRLIQYDDLPGHLPHVSQSLKKPPGTPRMIYLQDRQSHRISIVTNHYGEGFERRSHRWNTQDTPEKRRRNQASATPVGSANVTCTARNSSQDRQRACYTLDAKQSRKAARLALRHFPDRSWGPPHDSACSSEAHDCTN